MTSPIITSQMPTKTWHNVLQDRTIADAICDRALRDATSASCTGPPYARGRDSRTNNTEHVAPLVAPLRSSDRVLRVR